MAAVCEVGATPVEVSQNVGVQLASCLLWLKSVKWVRHDAQFNLHHVRSTLKHSD